MPWIKIINVQLKQDVLNPRYVGMTRSGYFLAEKGEKLMFSYDPQDVSADTLRVIEKIKAGEALPLRYGTRYQAWAKRFEFISEVDYFDDPGAKCYD